MRHGHSARRAGSALIAVIAMALLPLATGAPALAHQAATTAKVTTAAAPGDVVSAQRIYAPGFEYARVWHIRYLSTDTHGASMTVSGTVIVPYGSYDGPRPVIGYAPGTHGMGDQCAPSARLKEGNDQEGGLIHQYGWQGYAVAVTDYQGLGTPGDHAYMVARSAGHALLDIVRAAQRLTGLPGNGPVGLAGYSQGGHAAAWAAQLAPTYAGELAVKGAAAGGTPANLRQVAAYNEGRENFGLVLAAGIGMDSAYPELDLESYLNDAGRAGIDELRNGCDFSPYANKRLSDYTTSNPLDTPAWQTRLDQQNPGGSPPRAPVLLYHSTDDEIIPYGGATALRQTWCGQRANVTFRTYYFLKHAEAAAWASPSVTSWMGDRLAGKPTSGNC
ncbi:MAG: lipase [Micromonosporaceae bacterium]|nr:lipase [Micromonosporaceae bacterium]